MNVIKWVLGLAFLFAVVIFGSKNMGNVTVNYYFGTYDMPLFLLMSVLIVIGAALAAMIGIVDQLKLKSRFRTQQKKIKELESELSSLRHLPLTEGSPEAEAADQAEV